MAARPERKPFWQPTASTGRFEIDVSNLAEAIEVAEGPTIGGASSMTTFAALAMQHGLEVCSADTDFARSSEIR